jgi:hypothetical protein
MGLESSDIILVERGNTLYEETYGNRANIESSDLLLVEREVGGVKTLYRCTYANWANANSTDLILVEANSTTNGRVVGQKYKETKSAWDFSSGTSGTSGSSGSSSYVDIHSANYAVPSSKLTFTYGNGSNQTTNFSVFEVQVEVTDSGSSSTGHLYIGFRNTAGEGATWGYPYYGDLPIGAVQILQSNGTSFRTDDYSNGDWNFAFGNHNPGGGVAAKGYYEWSTTDSSQGSTGIITDKTLNPGDPSNGFEFYTIETSHTNGERRFSYDTNGTVSSHVGAAQGVDTDSYPGDMSAVLPVGTENIPQDSASDDGGYLYMEASSTSTGNLVWLNAPEATNGSAILTVHNGDRIRIAYYGGSNGITAAKGLQPSDCIFLRWVEED